MNVDTFPAMFPFAADRARFMADIQGYGAVELEGLLSSMETTRATTNFAAQIKNVFYVVGRATETLGGLARLKTVGLTDALMQQQQELDYIFKEIAIEYADSVQTAMRPELRLGMLFGMTVLQVDSQNRIRERLAAAREAPQEKFSDL